MRCGKRRHENNRLLRISVKSLAYPNGTGEVTIWPAAAKEKHAMIDVYYWPTPNGKKVTILLEELGLDYNIVPVNIGRGDQFKPEFLKLNPNHRMPAIVDHAPKGGGDSIGVFESGAILMYLAEKAGRFWPPDLRAKYEVTQWVMWQMANQGPKLGECGHFRRLNGREGDQSYAITRFTNEANRLYGVLNNRLHDRPYLAGGEYTIADMIAYPWTVGWEAQGRTSPSSSISSAGSTRSASVLRSSAEWPSARTCRAIRASCRRKSKSASARSSIISAPFPLQRDRAEPKARPGERCVI
jgi:GST-like protein